MPVALTQLNEDEALRYMGCPPEKADAPLRAAGVRVRPGGARRRQAPVGLAGAGPDLRGGRGAAGGGACSCRATTCGSTWPAVTGRRCSAPPWGPRWTAWCAGGSGWTWAGPWPWTAAPPPGVEELCDQIEGELQGQFPGCAFPFRFSPGYGDLPLAVQDGLLELLDAPRRVGLCANDSHLLTPRKSVTAILGVARGEIRAKHRSCLGCPARESCIYRKAGGHCGLS